MTPKDKDPILKKVGSYTDSNATGWSVMKSILGSQLETLGRGLKNIRRPPHQYMTTLTSLVTLFTIEDFSILAREDQNLHRTIKEAIYIRANNPSLNRNVGKFHLPHIWDEVLLNIAELKLK